MLRELESRESSENENFESLKNKIFNIQDHNERLNFIKSLSTNDSKLFSKGMANMIVNNYEIVEVELE